MLHGPQNTIEAALLVAVGLLLAGIVSVYLIADRGLNRRYDVPLAPIVVPDSHNSVAEGQRLATVRGCFWCHGSRLEGGQYFASAKRGVIAIAPDLTRLIAQYSPAEFARAVRHGVAPDGTSVQPAMPAFAFYNMSDADLGAIMAYIGSLPAQNGLHGEFRLLPIGWARWAMGRLPPNAADLIDHTAARPDSGSTLAQRGRYLAESICTECHGDNGRIRVPGTPDLGLTAAYSRAQFGVLMRSGVALAERPIDYHMVDAARYRYSSLTEAEVDALYEWLSQPVPP